MKHILHAEVKLENLREVLKNVGISLAENMKGEKLNREEFANVLVDICKYSIEFMGAMCFSIYGTIPQKGDSIERLDSFIASLKKDIDI